MQPRIRRRKVEQEHLTLKKRHLSVMNRSWYSSFVQVKVLNNALLTVDARTFPFSQQRHLPNSSSKLVSVFWEDLKNPRSW